MSRLAEKHAKDGLVVLSVNVWDEDKADLVQFAKENKLKQKILLFGSAVREQYGAPSIPASLWINRDGTIVDTELGFGGPGELARRTKQLISDGAG